MWTDHNKVCIKPNQFARWWRWYDEYMNKTQRGNKAHRSSEREIEPKHEYAVRRIERSYGQGAGERNKVCWNVYALEDDTMEPVSNEPQHFIKTILTKSQRKMGQATPTRIKNIRENLPVSIRENRDLPIYLTYGDVGYYKSETLLYLRRIEVESWVYHRYSKRP